MKKFVSQAMVLALGIRKCIYFSFLKRKALKNVF